MTSEEAVIFQYMEHGTPERKLQLNTQPIEFSVSVLTMGNWPSYQFMEVTIPPNLAEYQEYFQTVLSEGFNYISY